MQKSTKNKSFQYKLKYKIFSSNTYKNTFTCYNFLSNLHDMDCFIRLKHMEYVILRYETCRMILGPD